MEAGQHPLEPERIHASLGHSMFSRNIIYRKSLESTNLLARELARQGAPEGTLVLAEEQYGGRGRRGREWLSPGYANLLFSILLRPTLPSQQVFVLTMILALAGCEAVKGETGLRAKIKWPNDLYLGRKKLAGILTEFALKGKGIEYVILGLGLNVNWHPGSGLSTSVREETGRDIPRGKLLATLLPVFEKYYRDVSAGRMEAVYEQWNALSAVLGKEVEVVSSRGAILGTAMKINHDGALVIRDPQGHEQEVRSGDVLLTRWQGFGQRGRVEQDSGRQKPGP